MYLHGQIGPPDRPGKFEKNGPPIIAFLFLNNLYIIILDSERCMKRFGFTIYLGISI